MNALEIAVAALEEIHRGAFSPTGVATSALAAIAAQQVDAPSGYAYRYPGPYGGLRFNNGEEVNGSKPTEAVPYWLAAPPVAQASQVERDAALKALKDLHKVCQLALAGKDGTQHVYFESRAGHFVHAAGVMRAAEAVIAKSGQGE